ncbi:CHAD domain-containing protein [Hyalangium sp.]|uniref:CHAD domain-containing protein n=1 Tax=Hyalangium sp. TaxID=2028555 RepID=UPI002D53E439|nr:CHAD domain-containing protein [Hyalangium sp.]HYI00174.1 CHAD domain-containing protein [Hyalangium sp.]
MLRQLEQAEAAAERLHHPDDAEALHDLRVALRHLRTYLTAYRKLFAKAVSLKSLEDLRNLTRLTGPARDAEVQAAWLAEQSRARHTSSTARLRFRLHEHHAELLLEIRKRFTRDFPPLAARLRRQLERAKDKGQRRFGSYTAKQVLRRGRRLRKRLGRIHGLADIEGCHEARIAAKRVRYLLEPFEELRGAHKRIQHLKALQETLGQMHDLHVLLQTMTEAPENAQPPKRRGQGSELASLAASARRRLTALYNRVERDWLGEARTELDEALAQVASALRKAGRSSS